ATDAPLHCAIAGNHTNNTGSHGCGIVGVALHALIADNIISLPGQVPANTADGITGYNPANDHITVVGNVISNSANHGIHVGGNHLVVTGNTVYSPADEGIRVSAFPNSQPPAATGATITRKAVYSTGGAPPSGASIHLMNISDATVSGNSIDTTTGHGINIENDTTAGSAPTTISISGNTISNIAQVGIRLYRIKQWSCSGNTITTCGSNGIKADDGSPGGAAQTDTGTISSNTINGATTQGILVAGSAQNIAVGTNAIRNSGTPVSFTSGATNTNSCAAQNTDASNTIASAGTLSLPLGIDTFHVTGTTTITAINTGSGFGGRRVTLIMDNGAPVTNGSNLKLIRNLPSRAGISLTLVCDTAGNWTEAARTATPISQELPTNALAETLPSIPVQNQSPALASGTPFITAIEPKEGHTISNISYVSGTSNSGNNQTHLWFALLDSSLNVLELTSDDTNNAWNAGAVKTLPLAASYPAPADGLYYVAICQVATTTSQLRGFSGSSSTTQIVPILNGASATTGLTTPGSAPAQLGAITAAANPPYAYLT